MFEVQDLKYATLATVSRCGMVWFSEDVLSTDMVFNNFLARIRSIPLDEGEDEAQRMRKGTEDEEESASPMLQVFIYIFLFSNPRKKENSCHFLTDILMCVFTLDPA